MKVSVACSVIAASSLTAVSVHADPDACRATVFAASQKTATTPRDHAALCRRENRLGAQRLRVIGSQL
jgi:hypothetical protein